MDFSTFGASEWIIVGMLAIPVLLAVFAAIVFVVFRITWAFLTIIFHLAVIAIVAALIFGGAYLASTMVSP